MMNYRDEFKNIIENIKINQTTPPEEFNNSMQPMIQFIQKNMRSTGSYFVERTIFLFYFCIQ